MTATTQRKGPHRKTSEVRPHAPPAAIPTVVVERTIGAPAAEIFDAWLDPDSLAQWMRPGGIPRSSARVDPRVGGAWEVVMHHPDRPLKHSGVYRVIERPRRLVFTWVSDATDFTETLVTVEFCAAGKGTRIVLTHERLPDHEAALSHTQGWTGALELLAQLVEP